MGEMACVAALAGSSLAAAPVHCSIVSASPSDPRVLRRSFYGSAVRLSACRAGQAIWECPTYKTVSSFKQVCVVRCATQSKGEKLQAEMPRREAMAVIGLSTALSWLPCGMSEAAGLPPSPPAAKLCDADCERELESIPMTTTASGLQYKDIKVGNGPTPPVGFQVAADYVAMIPSGKVFDSSLEKGVPYIFRVGADQVIKGLDEGIVSMKVGGKRRLYISGELAFPKGLGASAGRPRVPPSSPVIFDGVDLKVLEAEGSGHIFPFPQYKQVAEVNCVMECAT